MRKISAMNSYEENLQLLINKVDGVNDLSWDDLCDRLNLDVHPDSLRKAFSVTDYCGYQVAQYYINNQFFFLIIIQCAYKVYCVC